MKSIPYIIITILLLALFLQHKYTPEPKTIIDIQTTTDTIHDTITKPTVHYIPKPIFTDTGSTKWRLQQVDTLQILASYFAKRFYQDTLQNDSNALIVLTDTVSQNHIMYRQPQITLYNQIVRQKSFVEVPQPLKRKLFIGLSIGRNPNQFSVAPSLMYQSKKEIAYSLSYDLLNMDMYFTFYYKLRLK